MMVRDVGGSKGWSRAHSSLNDVDTLFCLRSLPVRLPVRNTGVAGLLEELKDSVSASKDGIDSVERDRADDNGSKVLSLSKLPLPNSGSSGGLRSVSQERGLVEDRGGCGGCRSLEICVLRFAADNESRRGCSLYWRSASGRLVIARTAAIEGGVDNASCGTWISCPFFLGTDSLVFPRAPFRHRVGMTTGFEEVGGEGVKPFDGAVLGKPAFSFFPVFLGIFRCSTDMAIFFSLFLGRVDVGEEYR